MTTEILFSPKTADVEQAQLGEVYWHFLVQNGVEHYIANVQTQFAALKLGETTLPITLNKTEYESCYVCSPYAAYIDYAKQELAKLGSPWLERGLRFLLTKLGLLFKRCQINKNLHVNNWCLSTNLYPALEKGQIVAITQVLLQQFPQHALIFRSLNETCNKAWLDALLRAGYRLYPSRQIYLIDTQQTDFLKLPDLKKDLRLLKNSTYRLVEHHEITANDYPRIVELYNQLYLEKYSRFNPHFTQAFIQLCHERQILYLQGLRNEQGRLDGIAGYLILNSVLTAPLFGYDLTKPRELGLYRLLTLRQLLYAKERSLWVHLSSGVGRFKRLRGGKAHVEYSAVYHRHLPWTRRLPWAIIQGLTRLLLPWLKKYEL